MELPESIEIGNIEEFYQDILPEIEAGQIFFDESKLENFDDTLLQLMLYIKQEKKIDITRINENSMLSKAINLYNFSNSN